MDSTIDENKMKKESELWWLRRGKFFIRQETMATISLADGAIGILPHHLFISSGVGRPNLFVTPKKYSLTCRKHSYHKRKLLYKSDSLFKSRDAVCCSVGESGEASIDIASDGTVPEVNEDALMAARKALYETQSRQETLEKERDQLLKELATSKVKQQEFLAKVEEENETGRLVLEAERKKASSKNLKVEVEATKGSVESSNEVAPLKDEAYTRRYETLHRAPKAAESASKIWRQRAELAEPVFPKSRLLDERDEDAIVVGGRLALLIDDDSQKSKLLSDGPRREIPDWMARRIGSVRPKFPPRKINISEANTSKFKSLELPNPAEVWSVAQAKPKYGDTLIEHVIEKEFIEKKRKALERALQRKTIQYQKTPEEITLEPGTGTGREIVFQGFNWESCRRRWYLDLAPKAADLSRCGITAVWLPPPTESVAPQGYMPSDLYNLNSAYGTQEELKYCIEEMHNQHLLALGDVVLNHRCAHKQSANGVWNIFGGKLAWGPEAIVCDDPNFQGRGNPSSGDIFHAAPNIDHSQDFVREDVKQWLNWLRNNIGYDGWRLDFVRGFSGGYVKEYIEASNPAFAIGEYWDSLAYEGGNLCYNQDAHRQRVINWINATGGTSSAFDVTTKGILHSALHNQYWRLIDPHGKPTGVMGWWPSRAVTFLENHDTGSTQGHWPFPRDKLMQGYAYILTHPGTVSSSETNVKFCLACWM
ncbi:Glycoside hydrolase, catalytic domain-containing protein, partial [Cynara cardunculus var. scolymus]